jgi:hypothetical protein
MRLRLARKCLRSSGSRSFFAFASISATARFAAARASVARPAAVRISARHRWTFGPLRAARLEQLDRFVDRGHRLVVAAHLGQPSA